MALQYLAIQHATGDLMAWVVLNPRRERLVTPGCGRRFPEIPYCRRSFLHVVTLTPRLRILVISAAATVALAAVVVGWVFTANARTSAAQIPQSVLGADTRMGAVELRVKDLQTVRRFYEEGVGLEPLGETGGSVSLGVGGEEIIRLTAAEGDYTNPADAGLYHAAVLYSDGPALAQTLVRLVQMAPNLYQGSADHAVSHAFYFTDPEGNGVELYIDTPADTWKWQDGQVQMGSAPLDPNDFIARHLGQTSDGTAAMGHVHLKVGDLVRAREFYVDTLGFAVTSEVNEALFMSVGGYHHHLAANVWGSAGSGDRPDTLGLGSFTVRLAGPAELDAVAGRLDAAGIDYQHAEDSIAVADPWGNQIYLSH